MPMQKTNPAKHSDHRLLSPRQAWLTVLLLVILAIVVAIRIRLLNMPLERDEGEYAYAGQLLLQGVSPYQAAYNVTLKLPGTCVAYALIMAVFGQTASALHAGGRGIGCILGEQRRAAGEQNARRQRGN